MIRQCPRVLAWVGVTFIVLTSAVTAASQANAPVKESTIQRPPTQGCSAQEHRQFDFWLGEWDVSAGGKPVGRNRIESVLNGCALVEHWEGAGGGTGTSLNAYAVGDRRWHQTWVDGQGGRLALSGGWDEATKRMALSGTVPDRDGTPVRHELSWEPRPDGTVRQYWRASRDGGATWRDVFDGVYRRRAR